MISPVLLKIALYLSKMLHRYVFQEVELYFLLPNPRLLDYSDLSFQQELS